MEACIDTFASVFGATASDYKNPSRNVSPFNHNFENACQNHHHQFSLVNTSVNNANNNGHYHHNLQQQLQIQQRQPNSTATTSSATMFPSTTSNEYMQAMSWTDRPLSNSTANILGGSNNGVGNSGKMQLCSNSSSDIATTAAENHGFHPFVPNDGVSAAFNLQQLHQGICSVGNMPSWQQAFTFNDCASTNVPSQNDEGNDTRSLPMPLSMSSVPTTTTSSNSNNLLANDHHSSVTTANNDNHRYLNPDPNMQCPPTSSATGNNINNRHGTTGSNSLINGQYPTNQMQVPNSYAASSNGSLTLTFSASLLNGEDNNTGSMVNQQSRSPQHSPLPPYSVTAGSTESTPDYVKMATTPTRHVRLRTNTKMDMDRLKAQEEDKREREQQQQQRAIRESKAVPVALPPAVNVVVPSQVLQVTSALENPTPFHVEQKRKFNIKQYCAGITNSLPDVQGASSPLGGSTAGVVLRPPAKHNRLQHLITDGAVSSAPPNYNTTSAPLSPIPVLDPAAASSPGPSQRSSVATSVNDEFEDSILDLLLDEKTGDGVASLPQPGYNRVSGVPEGSSSCPADSTKDGLGTGDPVKVTKDRIKKDNHNKIERKRRFHINDMITEQGKLLPRPNERHHEKIGEVKQNKGSILKASVDYTKVLKQDNEVLHHKLVKAEEERKQLLLRLQRVEQLCKQSGVQIPEDIMTWKTASASEDLTNLLSTEVRIKQEPMTYSGEDFERNICDMMDEDRSIVLSNNDPMFGQPVETDDGFHHPEGMDFND